MQPNPQNFDYLLNIIPEGDMGVGKTKLTSRFSKNTFTEYSECTIGMAFILHTLTVDENTVKFYIWDANGAERYTPLRRLCYSKTQGFILAFDITNRQSFVNLTTWHKETKENAPEDSVIMIVGTKADLEDKRVVTTDEAKDFADKLGYMYIETSAKTGMNVDNLFLLLAREIIERINSKENNSKPIKIEKPTEGPEKKSWCLG